MTIVSWDDLIAGRVPPAPSVASIGVFDGVHRGHQRLFSCMQEQRADRRTMVVTFRQNPKKLMHPAGFSGDICSLDQKMELIDQSGIALCVLIDFSVKFSKMSGEDFVHLLAEAGAVESFVIGWNFAFGHGLQVRAAELPAVAGRYQATARLVDPVLVDGKPISSSRIRHCINEGKTDQALAMLGRPYALDVREYDFTGNGAGGRLLPVELPVLSIGNGSYKADVCTGKLVIADQVQVEADNSIRWSGKRAEHPQTIVSYHKTDEHGTIE